MQVAELDPSDLETAREVWRLLAGAPEAFAAPGICANVGEHRIAPDGWVGTVALGDSAVVAVRDEHASLLRSGQYASLSPSELTTPAGAASVFGPATSTLGPAVLALGRPTGTFGLSGEVVGPVPFDDARVRAIVEGSTQAEVDESSLESSRSGLLVALDAEGHGASACGYTPIATKIAHMGVLTAEQCRGQGWGRIAAAAAIEHAVRDGLLVQWRAAENNTASIRLAQSLGLQLCGRQFSFQPAR